MQTNIKFLDRKYVKNEVSYLRIRTGVRRGLVTALHVKFNVLVIKNENALVHTLLIP